MAENTATSYYTELYRPQFHFSPETMWMNDPNGMVYNEGLYHLFYQYHPDSTVWGPMHWGHATSKDLLHWEHKPVALYPDENGYIFSGSAVADLKNTSGFGTDDNPPLVAIFTYHDAEKNKAGESGFETQGIAYSLNNGDTWEKYEGNPVVGDENETDFRDPKVMWYEPDQKWIMSLVAGDHAEFYGSKNLKEWELLGEFGKNTGAHGGVWECPDLFKLKVEGTDEEKWVLLISINPGAPNGGSGTQYFIGDFNGKTFTTEQTEHRWIDWGTDNYAGVTFNNAPNDEPIFLGWMSNWLYANKTPTEKWRGAMTLPRKLSLRKVGEGYSLFNYPIDKLDALISKGTSKNVEVPGNSKKRISSDSLNPVNLMPAEIRFDTSSKNFRLRFGNDAEDKVLLKLDGNNGEFTLDRSNSGQTDFQEDFAEGIQKMPVPNLPEGDFEVRILMDNSSIEIFLNQGQHVMTAQLFPREPYSDLTVKNPLEAPLVLINLKINSVERVW